MKVRKISVHCFSIFTALSSGVALGQDAPGLKLEEVLVTAQKRTESLQDVPISVSVTTREELESRGINNLNDLANYVPGFQVGGAESVTRVAIRGFAGTGSDIIESPVVTLIDGAFISNNRLIASGFYDLDRIEILRGPQGTLFGKNALGGVLQISTTQPTEEFEGYVKLEAGNYELYRGEMAVSGQLADGLYGRVSALKAESDGWMDNSAGRDGGGIEDENFRLRLRWDASDALSVDMKYENIDHQNVGSIYQLVEVLDPSILQTRRFQLLPQEQLEARVDKNQAVGPADFVQGTILDRETKGQGQDGDLALLKFMYKFDSGYDLTATTNYVDYTNERRIDSDFLMLGSLPTWNDQEYETWSQEIQIRSPDDGRFSFIAGAYVENNQIERSGPAALDFDASGGISDGLVVPTLLVPYQVLDPDSLDVAQPGIQAIQDALISGARLTVDLGPGVQELERDIWSVYFEGRYQFNDSWQLIAGVRYNYDELDAKKPFINRNSIGDPLSSYDWIDGYMAQISADPAVLAAAAAYPGGIDAGSVAPGFPVGDLSDDFYTAVADTVALAYSYVQLPDGKFDDSRDEDAVTPSVKLQYFHGDSMYYAAVSTGFKGGGFNLDSVTSAGVTEFDSEEAISYELGAKLGLMDGAAQLNLSLFRTEFDDLQLAAVNETGTFSFQNAANATSQGLEIESTWLISEGLTAYFAYTYLDAEYDDFDTAPCSIFDPNVGDGCTQDLGGKPLQRAPDNQATLIFDYNRPLGGNLALETSLGATYTDEFSVSASDDFYSEDTHSMFARVALLSPGNGWTVAARIDNITDEDAIVTRQPTNLVGELVIGAIQTPRTYSLQLMKEF